MSGFPLGLSHLGVLDLPNALSIQAAIAGAGIGFTGNVYYCDPVNGLDTNDGKTVGTAVQSLLAGYNLLVSGRNDVLVLIGNGASTGSARITTFSWAKTAAHLIGICAPSSLSQRARIAFPTTAGLTVTAAFFTVSGSGCLFQNLSFFQGAGAGQTGIASAICMTVTGTRNVFVNCDFEGMGDATAAVSTGARNILLNGGGEHLFRHCNIGLDTVVRTNINSSVEVKGATTRNIFEDCTFLMWSSDGLQFALYGAAAFCLDRFVLFKGCNFIAGVGTKVAAAFNLPAGAGGLICLDALCGVYNFTATGDTATKAQTWQSGAAATNGVRGVVAS